MTTVLLLLITGLGLGALYFLVASGLSLIYGLMGVLNFAHGSFLTLAGFLGWEVGRRVGDGSWSGLLVGMLVGLVVGALVAAITELVFIRPLYNRHIEQVLVTVGLGLASVALFEGIWGTDPIQIRLPEWLGQTTISAPLSASACQPSSNTMSQQIWMPSLPKSQSKTGNSRPGVMPFSRSSRPRLATGCTLR